MNISSIANDPFPIQIYFSQKYLSWWKEIEQSYQSEASSIQKNAYLNFLMTIGILKELETDIDLANESILVVPSQQNLVNIWRKIPGLRLQIGETSMIFVPIQSSEDKTFQVPLEWIDILAAQYYIAVQIDAYHNRLEILGGTTYDKLTKEQGKYNPNNKNYEIDQLLAWSTILVARKYCPQPKSILGICSSINLEFLAQQ